MAMIMTTLLAQQLQAPQATLRQASHTGHTPQPKKTRTKLRQTGSLVFCCCSCSKPLFFFWRVAAGGACRGKNAGEISAWPGPRKEGGKTGSPLPRASLHSAPLRRPQQTYYCLSTATSFMKRSNCSCYGAHGEPGEGATPGQQT